MTDRDFETLKLLAFGLWLTIVNIGILLILHGTGYIAIPFLPPVP